MVYITNQVCSEVYDIIYHMEKELFNKIPKDFIDLINKNRDEKFVVNLDYTKSVKDQELQQGTKVLLSLIYRDYLCSKEQRAILIQKDKEELQKIEQEKAEKYNYENLFKKNEVEKEQSMIIYKESILQKLLSKIKSIFK